MPVTRTIDGETREWNGSAWVPVTTSTGQPEMYHPGLSDTPREAGVAELLRTGKETALGLVRSPWDALKGLVGVPAQIVKGLISPEGLPALMADPSLLKETPAAIGAATSGLGANPREAGSLLGQLFLGRYGVPAVAPKVPGALTKVGGVAERAGTTLAESKIGGFGIPGIGVAEAVFRGDPKGIAVAAAPYAIKYGGKGIRKLGESLEGLKRSVREPEIAAAPERVSREVPYRAPTSAPYTYEPSPGPQLDVVEPAIESQVAPTAADVEALYQSIPETEIPQSVLPESWESFTENPVTQGLRQVLEELRQRPTAGLTNPTGR